MSELEESVTPFVSWIFDRSSYPLDRESKDEYLDYYEIEIGRMGMLLRFLGLAEEADWSFLGWVPTDRFAIIRISKHKHRRKVKVSQHDRDFVVSIYRIATGDGINDDTEATEFCFKAMEILGLLKEGANGRFKATPRLKELVLQRLLERAVKETQKGTNNEEHYADDEGDAETE
jgi:hypothetical protein